VPDVDRKVGIVVVEHGIIAWTAIEAPTSALRTQIKVAVKIFICSFSFPFLFTLPLSFCHDHVSLRVLSPLSLQHHPLSKNIMSVWSNKTLWITGRYEIKESSVACLARCEAPVLRAYFKPSVNCCFSRLRRGKRSTSRWWPLLSSTWGLEL